MIHPSNINILFLTFTCAGRMIHITSLFIAVYCQITKVAIYYLEMYINRRQIIMRPEVTVSTFVDIS